MGKIIKEDCKTISINELKKWGYLCGYNSGTISWTSGWSDKKSSVSFSISVSDPNEMYFKLSYTITDHFTGEKHHIEHKYPLVTTPCNYGGKRHWFICSVYNQGHYCGRRVAKLYLGAGSHYFACRNCYDLSYESRNRNIKGRFGYFSKFFNLSEEIENLHKQVKIPYRAGKPTKKYAKLIRKERILNWVLGMAEKELGKT